MGDDSSVNAKRILIAGGSHSEIPLIIAAKNLGYFVITSGNREADPGHALSDAYAFADFSDKHALLSVARQWNIDGIVSACNDFSATSVAFVASELGLPGHDVPSICLALHHKDKFRETLKRLNLPVPNFVKIFEASRVPELTQGLSFPVLVKPVDLTGGKGIKKCNSTDEIESALSSARDQSRTEYLLVEEFLQGTNHGVTMFLRSGRVSFQFADDEYVQKNPFLVGGTWTPSSLESRRLEDVREQAEKLAEHLQLVDGLLHLQCISTTKGTFIIEACRRCPGDLYPDFVRFATGFDYANAVLTASIGMEVVIPDELKVRSVLRHCAMTPHAGEFVEVVIPPRLEEREISRLDLHSPGTWLGNPLADKVSIHFFDLENLSFEGHVKQLTEEIRVSMRCPVK